MAREKKTKSERTPPDMSVSASARIGGAAPAAADAGQPSAEQIGAMRTQQTAAAFGSLMGALMRSPRHRATTLGDLDGVIVPALLNGQFVIANVPVPNRPGETVPVAALVWAMVSPAVDQRLAQATGLPLVLSREEWRSGDIPWLVDAIGPKDVVQNLIQDLAKRGLAGRMPKFPSGAV